MGRLTVICALYIVLLSLAACGSRDTETSPTPAQVAKPTVVTPTAQPPTPAPTDTPTDTPAPAQPPAQPPAQSALPQDTPAAGGDGLEAQVEAVFFDSLNLTPNRPPTGSLGIEGVVVLPLSVPQGWQPHWAAYTTGLRNFETDETHVIAFYAQSAADQVSEVGRMVLADNGDAAEQPTLAPDYLGDGSVTQAVIEPDNIWLQVEGGVGAHGGVYGLLRFDGNAITQEIVAANAAPGIGDLVDLNNDGVMEVTTNTTDYYVFCYACGVRLPRLNLWRWDGERMVGVEYLPLPAAAPLELSAINERAIELANAGLWRDAVKSVEEGLMLGLTDSSQTFAWNASLIRLRADAARSPLAGGRAPYPLLNYIFYGDYASAVNLMRPLSPEEIFAADSPLISGTVAAGWEETLSNWIHLSSGAALKVMPELAPAHFLYGWASYLVGDRERAIQEIQEAAANAPEDALYRASLSFLQGGATTRPGVLTPLAVVNVRSGPGAAYPIIAALDESQAATITGRYEAGGDLWWQVILPGAADERGWVTGDAALVKTAQTDDIPSVTPPALVAPVTARGRIFFSGPDENGVNTIFSMDAVANAEPVPVIAEAAIPALHPQGDRLAFTSLRSDMLGLGGVDLVTGERLRFSYNIEDTLPGWNPDGDRLIFASTRESDRRWRLYRSWADGADRVDDLGFGQDPAWHPFTDQVVFKGCDDAGAACGLWLMAADGSNRRSLTDNAGDSRPRWSPDGANEVFMSNERDGNWEVYRVSVADGSVARLTNDPANDGLPVFDPNGGQIAFVSDRGAKWEILVMSATGGQPNVIYSIGPDLPNWLEQGLEWGK